MEAREDAVVVGAGVIGLCTALALVEGGRRVRVIDAGRVGGGSSHGNCGTITPSHAPPLAAPGMVATALQMMRSPDSPLYIRPRIDPVLWRWLYRFAARCNARDWEASARAKSALLNDSRARLQEWIARHGLDCEFVESGEDYVFRDPRRFEHGQRELPLLGELGIGVELIDGATYEAQEPAMKPGVAGAIRFSGDAALRPDRYIAALADTLRARGVVIDEHCALESIDANGGDVSLRTPHGVLRARDAVIATGAWSPRLAVALGQRWLRHAMQPGKGYSITYSTPSLVPKRPLVLRERSVCVTAWGSGFRLGSTMEFSGFDDTLNERRLGALERGAAEYLHEPVGPEVRERWFGWRPMSCDDVPIIGLAPGHEHLWLATGHGMMGVGMSAGTGQLLADLMLGRAPAIDPTPYRPSRFV
ncbi:NAD(P)/FAD-dependent oxidoreductase [Cognatilysobacter bugurensis]|uniref:D-amino-acid dehydrogenase n=1 Tax=Cognatilysobacter bugurensis TaxID=543356 RepID=A0A918SRV2_9GAMM|nr:FAD-dependent oxidoreductase [Lysobacter bugurensis]GHA68850.1 D-amino-acid dehydrogenase [Lysobacter bugurensis]